MSVSKIWGNYRECKVYNQIPINTCLAVFIFVIVAEESI